MKIANANILYHGVLKVNMNVVSCSVMSIYSFYPCSIEYRVEKSPSKYPLEMVGYSPWHLCNPGSCFFLWFKYSNRSYMYEVDDLTA